VELSSLVGTLRRAQKTGKRSFVRQILPPTRGHWSVVFLESGLLAVRGVNFDISLVVLTHNRIERCVDSVRRNAAALKGTRGEILLINNGRGPLPVGNSVDGVPCRQFKMARNLGASARNLGIREARSDHLLMLDDDAYIRPGSAERMLKKFRDEPQIGAVGFRVQGKDGKEETCLLPTVFHGCACGFRKSALLKTGGYPSGFLYYGEEYDLAFRLHAAGYLIGVDADGCRAHHARDAAGRDKNRIVKLLVRNNSLLWMTFFPWRHVPAAVRDTLQRYARVAKKENAEGGFRQGLASIPHAFLRGLSQRKRLDTKVFDRVTLVARVREACRQFHGAQVREVVICGVGKFPSMWVRTIRSQGLRVSAFLERNPLWEGGLIDRLPVRVLVNGEKTDFPRKTACLVGTASRVENERWTRELDARRVPYVTL